MLRPRRDAKQEVAMIDRLVPALTIAQTSTNSAIADNSKKYLPSMTAERETVVTKVMPQINCTP